MNTTSKSTTDILAQITAQNASGRYNGHKLSSDAPSNEAPEFASLGAQITIQNKNAKTTKRKAVSAGNNSNAFEEPNINRRVSKTGQFTYTVQIRRRVVGKQHSLTRTFKHLQNAKTWRNKRLKEIDRDGFPLQIVSETTISDVIIERLTRGKAVGRSATQNLKYIRDSEFGDTKVATLTQDHLYDFADLLLAGERSPQTVAGYMVHLAAALKWSKRRGALIPIAVVIDAMEVLWEDELLARSEARDRRPELAELDKILTAIVENKRQKIPVAVILVFAIYSGRRLSEICKMRWDDLNITDSKVLIREMKHPRKKKTNNVWCDLPTEALRIILSMPKTSEFIFPYNSRSVGTAYRRHRDAMNVINLRFHDFRHEAISRLSEMGMQLGFVAKVSGHKGESCLERYIHVEKVGDKYADWPWLERIIQMNHALA